MEGSGPPSHKKHKIENESWPQICEPMRQTSRITVHLFDQDCSNHVYKGQVQIVDGILWWVGLGLYASLASTPSSMNQLMRVEEAL